MLMEGIVKRKELKYLNGVSCFLEIDCFVRDNFGFGFGFSGVVNYDFFFFEKVILVRKFGIMLLY